MPVHCEEYALIVRSLVYIPFNSDDVKALLRRTTTGEGLYAYAVLTADTMMTDKMSWGKKPPAYDLYIAPWLAGTAFLSATSMGGATSMTAMILMRSPGRKGMTQAAREAARVILVWAMNHAVPIM